MRIKPRHCRRRLLIGGSALALSLCGCLLPCIAAAALPDNRGWELVSPLEKNGGQIDSPGSIAGGGVFQVAASGGAATYSSKTSFGSGAGAPPASQYLSLRGPDGWSTENLTVPVFSGTFDFTDGGAPYQIFSTDLTRGLLLNGDHCRGGASGCAVANSPVAGSGAPGGYQDYYLREGDTFKALVTSSAVAGQGLDPATFDLHFAGGSPDLKTVVISTCAPLTATALDGCGSDRENLYRWSESSGALNLLNSSPGATLAAQASAISNDGSRIYWEDANAGDLHLWTGGSSEQVDADAGGGGSFQAASADGSIAYYTKSAHLWRFSGGASTDLTPGGGVVGVLGVSASGSHVYYQDAGGLKLWHNGATATVAAGSDAAAPSTYPPAVGAARASADGTKLLFVSLAQPTGYDNTDRFTGSPDSQVFLYDAVTTTLSCVSCNPKGKRPIGPSTIPGATANGTAPGSAHAYKPRALSDNGKRVFFDSADALVNADSNSNPVTRAGVPDVYEWEAQGEGTCSAPAGCIGLLSSGSSPSSASFLDASMDGGDAYFLTSASLVGGDLGAQDLYVARIGGGFPEPPAQIPCEGDACQVLPAPPFDPSLATLEPGVGNPPVSYHKYCRKGYVKRKDKCAKRKRGHSHHRGKR